MKSSRSRFGADGLLPSFGVRVCSLAGKVRNLKLTLYMTGFVGVGPQNIVSPKFARVSSLFRGNFMKKRINTACSAIIAIDWLRSEDW